MNTNNTICSSKQHRDAQRVLDALDRWDKRFEDHFIRQRSHGRKAFRGVLKILLVQPQVGGAANAETLALQAWTRNVSQSGLSFIYPKQIQEKKMLVCLTTSAEGGIWFQAEVVRARPVQEGFWEYGVLFLERAQLQ